MPTLSPAPDVRARAALTVAAVMHGTSLDEALPAQAAELSTADAALLRALAYGVLREHRRLADLAAQLLERPLRGEPGLHALLLCGLHQLRAMRVPPHAAVAATVAAAEALGKPWAKNLVNAVLRRYQRERAELEARLPEAPARRYSCPDWLAQALRKDWPQDWERILAAGNEQGPLCLRMNRQRITRDACLAGLAAAGIAAQPVAATADALRLEEARPVEAIPGFAEGQLSVQDAAAQLAAELVEARPGQRVLDACAAPGGKAAHLLERTPGLELLAVDSDAARLERVRENFQRLGLEAGLLAADAARPSAWWDNRPFDRILLDAPCSSTGVIRRHPDIKWLRREADIPRLAELQGRLLRSLWPLLAPGGVLVYATCSVLRAEGEEIVTAFLANQAEAREQLIEAEWGEPRAAGRRIAPGGDFDGFYYARLEKRG
jgi:16S rRNA (cytosine967-C5)-methyltransferase